MNIAILGATGAMGYGLALRLARLGHAITIGSRQQEKAGQAAQTAREKSGCDNIQGVSNEAACAGQDLIILSVPSAGHRATLESLKGVIGSTPLLDVTVPLAIKPIRFAPPPEGSNALEAQAILGEEAKIACGFHTLAAELLSDLEYPVEGDLLIAANNEEAMETVLALGKAMGLRAFNAGSLLHSPTLESLTPMLIGINRRYGKRHIGIGLSGI